MKRKTGDGRQGNGGETENVKRETRQRRKTPLALFYLLRLTSYRFNALSSLLRLTSYRFSAVKRQTGDKAMAERRFLLCFTFYVSRLTAHNPISIYACAIFSMAITKAAVRKSGTLSRELRISRMV